ncbi:MAG: zinc ribbon domain-containing protein [Planctomycetota bacterium]|nr:zinc ribbon domain-containing protein [Planctomycetota bacterium]
MPTYDYLCDGCGHGFELFQKVDAKLKKTCQECGQKKLRRLIGAGGGIIFKGSGFYETDYRSSEYKKRQKEESGSSSKDAGKSDAGKSAGVKSDGPKSSDTSKTAKNKNGSAS